MLAIVGTMVLPVQAAVAHGPCSECTSPKRGPAGTTVRVKWTAIKVVWNPTRSQVPYGDDHLWAAHHAREPSLTLFRSTRPRTSRFRVPDAAPGTYGVAIYDGSEGGTHYTWSYFKILPSARDASRPASTERTGAGHGGGHRTLWLLGGGAGALLVFLSLAVARHRHRPAGLGRV